MEAADVEQLAAFLASHALLLPALAILVGLCALGAILLGVRALGPLRARLRPAWSRLVERAARRGALDAIATRIPSFARAAYVGMHLVSGLLVVGAGTAFLVVAEEVSSRGRVAAFDVAFARELRERATDGAREVFTYVSWFGSREVLAFATLAVAIVLWHQRRSFLAVAWIAAQAGGGVLNWALKAAFERARPEFAGAAALPGGWSFPSGHAMGTFIFCGVGVYLLIRHTRSWTLALTSITVSLVWCIVMSFSRLYLGVHYATDVVAGVVAGAAWVAVCISALESVRQRGASDVGPAPAGRAGRRRPAV